MDSQSSQYFYAQQGPSYSQQSFNQPASNFQSSTSLASMGSSPHQTNMSSRHSPTLVSAAPVSSPRQSQQYFTSLPGPMSQVNPNAFQQIPQPPQQHRGSFCEGQRSGNDASAFLQDFSLIAEAAKRAQMAVLMRDFDDLEM